MEQPNAGQVRWHEGYAAVGQPPSSSNVGLLMFDLQVPFQPETERLAAQEQDVV